MSESLSPALAALLRRRALIYAFTFLSGCVALTFQVVWQKYLSFLVGSEARSISLVVAVFLLGLAAGYQFWGTLTERNLSRKTVLKIVGYIELGIALYALTFPHWFTIVKELSYSLPDWLAMDFLMTAMLLLLPTFGMGASIPLLTAAVPDTADEVNYCHSRIYGINTLGAFAGTFIAGFYFLPTYGLPTTLAIGAAANMLVGLYFVANTLGGPAHKAEEVPLIPNRFGATGIYLFVFTTGAVSIGYEILFMRILGLSIGSGHYIFPIVVGVVILGLAIGSLSLRRGSVTADRVMREIVRLTVLLGIVYLTVPHWPYWLSHVRVSLTSIPSNYGVFMTLVVLFISAMLLPIVIPMGRLLPIGYALIDKNRNDYGKVCGRVYFINTLGTVAGAVGIAYVLFFIFDLPTIYKINMTMMLGLAAFLYFRHGRPRATVVCMLLAAAVFALPQWDRQFHYLGIFRISRVEPYHFQGVFALPQQVNPDDVVFMRDDPGVTVVVQKQGFTPFEGGQQYMPLSIVVNGKSDGHTIGDYSNMSLTGILPYMYARPGRGLDAAVVGLGTGITSGVLAAAQDINLVTTLEISPAVIEAVQRRGLFDDENFHLSRNPKSRIIETDAFRFFARTRERFDMVISEPSNPWVVGVENLFTPEYYRLVSRVLNDGGILFQWVQVYEMTNGIFAAIIENVAAEFEHISLFFIGSGDVGIIASHQPFDAPHFEQRWSQTHIRRAMHPMGLEPGAPLHLLELFGSDQLRAVALGNRRPPHTLEFPWLGHAAGQARFRGESVSLDALLPSDLARHLKWPDDRRLRYENWLEHYDSWVGRCDRREHGGARHSVEFVCTLVQIVLRHQRELDQPLAVTRLMERLAAYRHLREAGYLSADLNLLNEIREVLDDGPIMRSSPVADARTTISFGGMTIGPEEYDRLVILHLVREYAAERELALAAEVVQQYRQAQRIPPRDVDHLNKLIADMQETFERFDGLLAH